MSTALETPASRRTRPGTPRRGSGWGLDLEGTFYAPGLLDRRASGFGRRTVVEVVPASEIKAAWSRDQSTRASEWRFPNGRLGMSVDRSAAGYHIYGHGFGRYLLSADGTHVRCTPAHVAAWRWQRFLVGQILPFSALLQGLEVMHASAVLIDGKAVALTGASGGGKSSLALNMVLRGAAFLTDDVLALETSGSQVLGHPGAGLASVRLAEPAISADDRERLGRVVGETDEEVRLAVETSERPVPIGAVCFLEPGVDDGPLVEAIPSLDPRLMLGSTFNFAVQTPERLARQLDVLARLAGSARSLRARVVPGVTAAALAEAIQSYLATAHGR